ncbi:MAG: hypothetical protein P4L52_06945 [Acidocella sp.]|nr:hypothetical protein [Acidocella sp.]
MISPELPWSRLSVPAVSVFSLSLAMALVTACPSHAESVQDKISTLAASIAAQQAKLNQEELQLEQQSLELNRQQNLLDNEMSNLRGAGEGSKGKVKAPADAAAYTASGPATEQPAQVPTQSVGAEQQQAQQENQDQQTKVILQSSTVLSGTGGVLTPKGQLLIDPSIEYDYWTQNQLNLNGFTIIPGITFGNIFVSRVDQRFLTGAVTARYGVTDRLEINLKIPVVGAFGSMTAQAAGPSAIPVHTSQTNGDIGDIQVGASYQFNSGDNGWPVFVGNLLFKTATGQSPYDVPVFTSTNGTGQTANDQLLLGVPKKLPTGTGFYSLQPSVTVFYATAPGVLFGNLQFVQNFGNSFNIPNPGGGPAVHEYLKPGQAIAGTFGIGFALNDKASMTFSYQEEHVFASSAGGRQIVGSAYDFGTFNFGLGYAITPMTNLNIGVGIGVGPYAPAAKILVELPTRFNLF